VAEHLDPSTPLGYVRSQVALSHMSLLARPGTFDYLPFFINDPKETRTLSREQTAAERRFLEFYHFETRESCTCPQSPPGFWCDHGQSLSAQAEIRNQKVRKSVNLARAVRISGDGGQEGRHLAKKKKKTREF